MDNAGGLSPGAQAIEMAACGRVKLKCIGILLL